MPRKFRLLSAIFAGLCVALKAAYSHRTRSNRQKDPRFYKVQFIKIHLPPRIAYASTVGREQRPPTIRYSPGYWAGMSTKPNVAFLCPQLLLQLRQPFIVPRAENAKTLSLGQAAGRRKKNDCGLR